MNGDATGGKAASGRLRLEELWSRWITSGPLSPAEERELATALGEDAALRDELLADQRLEGALQALGRGRLDQEAFARQFTKRVAAERDGRGFVSSVERRMRAEGVLVNGSHGGPATAAPSTGTSPSGTHPVVPVAPAAPRRLWAWAFMLVPAAALVALIPGLVNRQVNDPRSATATTERTGGTTPAPGGAAPRPAAGPGAAPATGALARVEKVVGAAYVLDHATKTPARPGMSVERGRGLLTVGPESRLDIAFLDSSTMHLEGDTALLQLSDGATTARGKEAFLARGRLTADVAPQPAGRPLLVSTPHSEATVLGTRFTLRVDALSTRLDVERGRVQLVKLAGGAPAVVGAAEFAVASDRLAAALTVTSRLRGTALLLAGNLLLSPEDELVKKRLEGLGFEVRVRGGGTPDAEELRRAALVLISASVSSVDINTYYREVAVPIIAWEPALFPDLGMTGPKESGECAAARSTGDAVIKNPAHPMAAGLAGTVQLLGRTPLRPTLTASGALAARQRPLQMTFGVPGPHADWIATWPGQPTRAVVFAYERGAPMPGLAAAPARRVGLFLYENAGPTEAGWAMFDAAALWAVEHAPR